MSTKKKQSILERALVSIDKTEKEVVKEILTDRLEDFIQLCTEDISNQTVSVIPTIETQITRANREVDKAKKARTVADLAFVEIPEYGRYVEHINTMDRRVISAETVLSTLNSQLEDAKTVLAKMNATLETLQS